MTRTRQNAARSSGRRTQRPRLSALASRRTARSSRPALVTERRWHVWLITDRAHGPVTRNSLYLVHYIVGPGALEQSYQPRWLLLDDGFEEYIQLVDDFKLAGNGRTFSEYCLSREDPFALAMGASLKFYTERAARGAPISECGVVWTTLQTFIRRLNAAALAVGGPEICMDTVAVKQRQAVLSGPNNVPLEYLLLAPGLYLVAGFAPYPARRSHAYVLEVTVTGRYASDDEAARVPLVDYAYPWLGGLQFVRRLVLRR
ncbi:hypothetical protein PC123_g3620 [Phytophthora cactorum]|nr:hypothetical protein PC120_g2483 [Phytophthora cactorum]KAG4061545.1 hypothetical protein PC123_g3620 [Phytophthora cactorum]